MMLYKKQMEVVTFQNKICIFPEHKYMAVLLIINHISNLMVRLANLRYYFKSKILLKKIFLLCYHSDYIKDAV